LTPKGRVFADALCFNVSKGGEEGPRVVLELHSEVHNAMLGHLMMHKLRSSISIKAVDLHSLMIPPSSSFSVSPTEDGLVLACVDPRGAQFGTRLIARQGAFVADYGEKKDDYLRFRLLNGLSDTPELLGRIPLECNLDLMNFISFKKGCYVGQELISRTKFRGLVRKRIQPYIFVKSAFAGAVEVKSSSDTVTDTEPESRVPESIFEAHHLGIGLGLFPVETSENTATSSMNLSLSAAAVGMANEVGGTHLRITEVKFREQVQTVLTYRPPFFKELSEA
jgi:folate-binding protein YgfZ